MSEQPPQEVDLAQELRELGEQLKSVIGAARDHPHTKEFEREISRAVSDLGAQIDRVIQNAKTDERVRKAGDQVKQAAQSVKESGAPDDIGRGLAKVVRALNEQIRRALEDAERARREGKSS